MGSNDISIHGYPDVPFHRTERAAVSAQKQAEFWERRYDQQHEKVHAMEDEIGRLRGILEQAVLELDGWRDAGSVTLRDEVVDDFIVVAKSALGREQSPDA